jgi:hypothetical protein
MEMRPAGSRRTPPGASPVVVIPSRVAAGSAETVMLPQAAGVTGFDATEAFPVFPGLVAFTVNV